MDEADKQLLDRILTGSIDEDRKKAWANSLEHSHAESERLFRQNDDGQLVPWDCLECGAKHCFHFLPDDFEDPYPTPYFRVNRANLICCFCEEKNIIDQAKAFLAAFTMSLGSE